MSEPQPAAEQDSSERHLANLVRRLRANPGRVVVLVAGLDRGPGDDPGAPAALLAHVRAAVEARLGADVRARVEADLPPQDALAALVALVAPDDEARHALVDAHLAGREPSLGEAALAALLAADVVRAALLPTGDDAVGRLLAARARPPRRLDLHDGEAVAATTSAAKWSELATYDPPWLRPDPDAADDGDEEEQTTLAERLASWLARVAPGGGAVVVGHDGRPGPLVDALLARAGDLRLGVTWLGGGAGEGRTALAAALPLEVVGGADRGDDAGRSPARLLDELRAKLGVPPLGEVPQPLVRRVLDATIDPPVVVARIPILAGYQDVAGGLPSVTVRSVLLALLALLGLWAALDAGAYLLLRRRLAGIEADVVALRAEAEAAPLASASASGSDPDAEAAARDRDRRGGELMARASDPAVVPRPFFLPGPLVATFEARAAETAALAVALDDEVLDVDLARHGLRARVRFDRSFGRFGRSPDPPLVPEGAPDARAPLEALLAGQGSDVGLRAAVVASRGLLLDVLLLRAADKLAGDPRLPIVVSLAAYDGDEVLDLVAAEVARTARLAEGDLSKDALVARLEAGQAAVLFVDVDEALRVERALHRVARFAEAFPSTAVVVGLTDGRLARDLPGFRAWSVAPLARADLLVWLEREGLADLAAALTDRPRLLDQARDPLLLSLAVRAWEQTGAVPGSRVELVERFLDEELAGRPPTSPTPAATAQPPLGRLAAKTLLAAIAGPLVGQGDAQEVPRDAAVEVMARLLKLVPEATLDPALVLALGAPSPGDRRRAEELLERLLHTGLLVPVRGDAVRFADPDLARALRARAIATRVRRGTWDLTASPFDAGAALALFPPERRLFDAHRRFQTWRSDGPGEPPDLAPLLAAVDLLGAGEPLDPGLEARWTEGLVDALTGPWGPLAEQATAALARLDRASTARRVARELERAPPHPPRVRGRVVAALGAIGHPAGVVPLLRHASAADGDARARALDAAAACAPRSAEVVAAVLSATAPGLDVLAAAALARLVAEGAPVDPGLLAERLRFEPARLAPTAAAVGGRPDGLAPALVWLASADAGGTPQNDAGVVRAARALVGLGAPLRQALRAELAVDPRRSLALAALAAFGDPEDADRLAAASAPLPPRSVSLLLQAAADLGPAGVAALASASDVVVPALGPAALDPLARLPEGRALLAAWLERPDLRERLGVAEALVAAQDGAGQDEPADAAGAERARFLLSSVLAGDDRSVRGRVRTWLARHPGPGVEAALRADVARCEAAARAPEADRLASAERLDALAALASVWTGPDLAPFEAAVQSDASDAAAAELVGALGRAGRRDALGLIGIVLRAGSSGSVRAVSGLVALGPTREGQELLVERLAASADRTTSLALLRALGPVFGPGNRPSIEWKLWLQHGDDEVRDAAWSAWVATE